MAALVNSLAFILCNFLFVFFFLYLPKLKSSSLVTKSSYWYYIVLNSVTSRCTLSLISKRGTYFSDSADIYSVKKSVIQSLISAKRFI